jgi:hypothetical protein
MVNYDLPWNPNRLEQRFGRIHRIGQTEVCHLWNLVATETREGDVYKRLLDKIEEARKALGGQVFDVLGKLQFLDEEGNPKTLRDLLLEAVRYGDQEHIKARLTRAVEAGVNRDHLETLIEDRALSPDMMTTTKVAEVREQMERAEARRLQPHYIESFFLEAFKRLGGTIRQKETRRYEITNVPAAIRNCDRQIGVGEPVSPRYERVTFEKSLIAPNGQPRAAFLCPGHPLLNATLDLTLERHTDLLRRGTVLVDERDYGTTPRVLFSLEHAINDGSLTSAGTNRTISRQILYVEMDSAGGTRHIHYAPYLDYRPLAGSEPKISEIFERPECKWISHQLEQKALGHAISEIVPSHLSEIKNRRLSWVEKTRSAVKDRLTKEIIHWDHRSAELKHKEDAGKPGARLNSGEARKRADELQARLQKRLADLERESQISALPPVVLGGLMVVPIGLIHAMQGRTPAETRREIDRQAVAARARAIVMQAERDLGFEPMDVELEKRGYDIESRDPKSGHLRFIEVKGRDADAEYITVTKNEVLYSLNNPERFILAMVQFHEGGRHSVHYLRRPFERRGVTTDFNGSGVFFTLEELIGEAGAPS